MKLDVKRTVLIGLGFLTIMMLWQVYNWMVPLFLDGFLKEITNNNELYIGIVMALDNLFALFMIPLMSNLSDKTKTKLGRRMPYIAVGIILSAVAFMMLPLTKTLNSVWLLIANILLVLLFMNVYRSPCIALMPDITPKALRSKANSIINILGGAGFAIGYLCVLFFSKIEIVPFLVVSVVMIICLAIMLLKVRENRFVEEYRAQLKANGISEEDDQKEDEEQGKKARTARKNVWLVLLVVFCVYMANNAVETFMSLYSDNVFGDVQGIPFNMNAGALAMVPFGIATFVFAYPSAVVAQKIGRKKTVLIGAFLMGASFMGVGLFNGFSYFLLIFFILAGMGFSFITINIYPMVVESCSARDTGRYTGYYYTASMLAQSITPAFCGLLIGNVFHSYGALFPYCAIFMGIVVVVLLLIKDETKNSNN